jgi:hypothetical protein
LIVNGGFESVITPWVMSGSGAFYNNNGTYPHVALVTRSTALITTSQARLIKRSPFLAQQLRT